ALFDARGAGVEALRGPTDHDVDGLDVRVPATARPAVRERDVVAEARPLAADVAVRSHFDSPLLSRCRRRATLRSRQSYNNRPPARPYPSRGGPCRPAAAFSNRLGQINRC